MFFCGRAIKKDGAPRLHNFSSLRTFFDMLFRQPAKSETATASLADLLELCQTQQKFYRTAVQELLEYVQRFSLDLSEIGADEFKAEMGGMIHLISSEETLSRLHKGFAARKSRIDLYIDHLKEYLSERETELKDIIEILSRAMAELDSENRQFHDRIFSQSDRIEQITLLDDIKKVKTALVKEVEGLKTTVIEKQKREHQRLQHLSRKVSTLNRELELTRAESMRDGLTGVLNRKSFDSQLLDLVVKNKSSRAPFSLLLIDIDDFKRINDTYGHPVGDRVLVAIANKCAATIRKDDLIARYGGEEFALILPGVSLRRAVRRARKICTKIGTVCYALDGSLQGQELSVTVSIGVSRFRNTDSVRTVLQRADRALYAAKEAGKNRVLSEKDLGLA